MTTEVEDNREFAVLSGAVSTALIETEDGPVPLDWLASGDRVLTRDAGYQPVRWVARTRVDNRFLRAYPEVAPVTVRQDLFGAGCPARDIVVSPSQLVPLVGVDGIKVLVSADVVGDPVYPASRPKDERFTYVNVLLEGHHLVSIEGAWMGSLFTADLRQDDNASGVMVPAAPILGRAAALTFCATLDRA